MQRTKLLLFDFDGVIVDSFPIAYQTMRAIEQRPLDEEGYRRCFDGNIYDDRQFQTTTSPAPIIDNPFFQVYEPMLLEKAPIAGIGDVLGSLVQDHTLVVISSCLNRCIERYFLKYKLQPYFTKIYGADVHKSKVIKTHRALEDFNASAHDAVFITDTLGDIREAERAGVRSIGVSWGFHTVDDLVRGNPVAIAHTVDDLRREITTWSER